MKIGFLGLGIMGRPMALNLLKGGHVLTVWARRAESMQPLLDAGAQAAAGPAELAAQVVGCGNTTGAKVDKFARFGLTPKPARTVAVPLVDECFANLECRVVDTRGVNKYNWFVLEVTHAWVDPKVKAPDTLHHRGFGRFMVAGAEKTLPSRMK